MLLANKSRSVVTNSSVPRIPIDRSTMDHSDQEETALESEAFSRLKISSEGIKKTDDTSQADPDVKEGSQQDMVEHSGGDFLANPFPPSGDYCIHISVDQIEGRGRQLPLPYAWNEPLVHDMAKHWMAHEVEEVKLLAPGEAILFMGCGTPTIGLTHDKASHCIRAIPIMDHWAGWTVCGSREACSMERSIEVEPNEGYELGGWSDQQEWTPATSQPTEV